MRLRHGFNSLELSISQWGTMDKFSECLTENSRIAKPDCARIMCECNDGCAQTFIPAHLEGNSHKKKSPCSICPFRKELRLNKPQPKQNCTKPDLNFRNSLDNGQRRQTTMTSTRMVSYMQVINELYTTDRHYCYLPLLTCQGVMRHENLIPIVTPSKV